MEPVINPMFFYWLSILDSLIGLLLVFALFSGTAYVLGVVGFLVNKADENDEIAKFLMRLKTKTIAALFLVFIILSIFTPSKETLIEMEVARNITYDRIDKVVEIGNDLKNTLKSDIIDIIRAIDKK